MRCVSIALLGVLSLTLLVRDASAQWRADLELSGARLRQDESASTAAVTIGSTIARESVRTSLQLSGLAAFGEAEQRTTQALGNASLLGEWSSRWRWSLGIDGSVFAQRGDRASIGAAVVARQHYLVGRGGGWLGLSAGGVNDRGDPFAVRSAEVGAWLARGGVHGALAATVLDTRSAYWDQSGSRFVLVSEPVTYTDVGSMLRWDWPRSARGQRLGIALRGGTRFIARGAADGPTTKAFGGIDAELSIAPRVTIAAAHGRNLSDLARGTPASRYLSIGLRLAMHRGPSDDVRRETGNGGPRVVAQTDADSTTIAVVAVAASRVEISGTFTSWEPVMLQRRDDRWVLPRRVESGTHRMLIRIDGGPWHAPRNLTAVDDGDGGRVGLLLIP